MKHNILISGILALTLTCLSSCSDDSVYGSGEGDAAISITPEICADVAEVPVSRASGDEYVSNDNLLQKLNIVVSTPKGNAIRYWNSASGIPWRNNTPGSSIDFSLNAGTYTVEAWTGDSIAASWTRRYFKGKQTVTLQPGTRTNVRLTCKIANTAVDAVYSDQIDNFLKHYSLVITTASTSLNFEGRETRTAYFMLPTKSHDIKWTFHGIDKNDKAYYKEDTIRNAKASTKYRFRINYEDPDNAMGAGAFDIRIDEESLDVEHTMQIRTSPEIKGYNTSDGEFEIGENNPISRATGNVNNVQVKIGSSGTLKRVSLSMNGLSALTGTSSDAVELLGSSNDIDVLKNNGILGIHTPDINKETSSYLLTLSSSFTNTLKEGEYRMILTAADVDYGTDDVNPKETTTVFRLIVSDDGATLLPATADDLSAATVSSLVLRGQVAKDDVDEVGFYYRHEGETNWTYIEGTPVSRSIPMNTEFTATPTGLHEGWKYEYAAAYNRKQSVLILTQSTIAPQLPNAGFENWQTSTPMLVYASGESMFWDTGNHGSSKMSKNVTTPATEIKHSGSYSAKLQSQFVGFGTIGRFAAGNIFIGEYLKTDGTDGVLGWGRPFTYSPRELRGYIKYTPATVGYTDNGAPDIIKGQLDKGIIYIALLDSDKNTQGDSSYPDYPVVVRTKDAHLFKKDAANVIAYGELVLDKATEGSGMVEFTIPLTYYRQKKPTYIMVTASASKGGDYFAGADGSVMYLDDLQLVY